MSEPAPVIQVQPRWPVMLAFLVVLAILEELPRRITLFPAWFPLLLGIIALAPVAAVSLLPGKARWLRIERIAALAFSVVAGVATLANLRSLIVTMIHRSGDISGLELLMSSVGVWVSNVLAFSVLYWHLDRGGPDIQDPAAQHRRDWLFPQDGLPVEDQPEGWQPRFLDYLFLGYCTATAFSPTDALPNTIRAKMLLMLESLISLMTIVVVASRAINILGG